MQNYGKSRSRNNMIKARWFDRLVAVKIVVPQQTKGLEIIAPEWDGDYEPVQLRKPVPAYRYDIWGRKIQLPQPKKSKKLSQLFLESNPDGEEKLGRYNKRQKRRNSSRNLETCGRIAKSWKSCGYKDIPKSRGAMYEHEPETTEWSDQPRTYGPSSAEFHHDRRRAAPKQWAAHMKKARHAYGSIDQEMWSDYFNGLRAHEEWCREIEMREFEEDDMRHEAKLGDLDEKAMQADIEAMEIQEKIDFLELQMLYDDRDWNHADSVDDGPEEEWLDDYNDADEAWFDDAA